MTAVRFARLGFVLPPVCWALCAACGGEADTTTAEAQQEQQQERKGPEGCYIEATHSCDCDLDEAACTEDVGIWTPGCMTCEP